MYRILSTSWNGATRRKDESHPTAFPPAVEASFAQHCMKLADFGFPLIPSDLKMCVTRYLDCKGVRVSQFTNNIPGDDWIRGFLKRNKDLSVKVSANIKKSCEHHN
ncbi:unnamed protein product [Macrosiphum euphorbiae]|uniref:HTH CENPB-type domain-containing protein n=1 Tax=Macrosiphum euphorbiae TaxID=13131 RepID=A0AAV0XLJ4_9HEMI|nr:unnamed protein product [Macrosiphum euphorbiae]